MKRTARLHALISGQLLAAEVQRAGLAAIQNLDFNHASEYASAIIARSTVLGDSAFEAIKNLNHEELEEALKEVQQ